MATQILPTGIKNFGSSAIDNIVLDTTGGVNISDGDLVVAHATDVTVNSPLQVNSTLNTTGNATLGGTLSVTGITTLTDDLVVNTDTLFVDVSSDRVGIGTSSPGATLDVNGSAHFALNVGIGTTSPAQALEVNGNIQVGDTGTSAARIDFGSASTRIQHNGDDNLPIYTNGAERMRIDTSGRLLVGASSSTRDYKLVVRNNAYENGYEGGIFLARATTPPVSAIGGHGLGSIIFGAAPEGDENEAAKIIGQSDGTWGLNDWPSRLEFHTTPDGSNVMTQRMRITSEGDVLIGGDIPNSANAEIQNSGLITSGGYPITRSFSFLKYPAYGYDSQVLNIDAEINAKLLTGTTRWSQATVTLMGSDGGGVGYWHGIYSKDNLVRATELASSGEVTLDIDGGNLTWPAGVGTGQWYNTWLTISYTAR